MGRIFTGDFSTGNFAQWRTVLTATRSESGASFPARGSYSAQVLPLDPDAGYGVRFEVRPGDAPVAGGERSHVKGYDLAFAPYNTTCWYAFSIKFDESFPTNKHPGGWNGLIEWKGAWLTPQYGEEGVPPLGWGWTGPTSPIQQPLGYWHLLDAPQSAPFVPDPNSERTNPIVSLPIDAGKWQDIKMEVKWVDGPTGTVRVWRNGVPQVLSPTTAQTSVSADGFTWTGKTGITPGPSSEPFAPNGWAPFTGVQWANSIYREIGTAPDTHIVYMTGFRMSDTEAGL